MVLGFQGTAIDLLRWLLSSLLVVLPLLIRLPELHESDLLFALVLLSFVTNLGMCGRRRGGDARPYALSLSLDRITNAVLALFYLEGFDVDVVLVLVIANAKSLGNSNLSLFDRRQSLLEYGLAHE